VSQGIIVTAVVVTAGTTFVAQASKGKIEFRSYLAAGFVGIFLSAMSLVNEQLARNFAILVILVALLRNGTQTLNYLGVQTAK
jgi:hypothetical protein